MGLTIYQQQQVVLRLAGSLKKRVSKYSIALSPADCSL